MKTVAETVAKKRRPVKILQYGEGNFLRAFVDYVVDIANEQGDFDGNVVIVKPIKQGSLELFDEQDSVYTVLLRGLRGGALRTENRVVTCVDSTLDSYKDYNKYAEYAKSAELRFIVSNTTEAGIALDENDTLSMEPPKSFPGKLTKFLYERFIAFNGAADKGLIILPCELIENNGAELRKCCETLSARWGLPQGFTAWLTESNIFCNTLVDRIVTGFPAAEAAGLEKELGYKDGLLVTGELFGLWVIECEKPEIAARELTVDKAGMPVIFTTDLKPYRERKVRILNGAHTAAVAVAYLCGVTTVGDMMKDADLREFLKKAVYDELVPMVPLPEDECREFAGSVMERFENPCITHNLLSIALNSVSKFRVRVLPTILDTKRQRGILPAALCFSFAALIHFYSNKDRGYEVKDDAAVLDFFDKYREVPAPELVSRFLSRDDFFGLDLNLVDGLTDTVTGHLGGILDVGMRAAMLKIL